MDYLGDSKSEVPSVTARAIRFQDLQCMWSQYLNVRDGRTDRRTLYCSNTTFCI